MNFFLRSSNDYYSFCEKVHSHHSQYSHKALVFSNLQQAIFETLVSLAGIFSHKMSIAVVEGTGGLSKDVSLHFSKLGYQVQTFHLGEKSEEDESIDKWLSELNKDTLFLFYEKDQFFTGEKFSTFKDLSSCHDRRIFTLSVSHHQHFYEEVSSLGDFAIDLFSLPQQNVLGLCGKKVKINALTAPFVLNGFDERAFVWEKKSTMKESVEAFEEGLSKEFNPYFSGSKISRLFDRAIFCTNKVDGEALLHLFSEKMNYSLSGVGVEDSFETASLCRWSSFRDFSWLGPRRQSDDFLRGTLVIKSSILNSQVKEALSEAFVDLKDTVL